MSEDVVIRISGQDAGGKALVDQLTKAIEQNGAAAKKHAAALKETGAAAHTAAGGAEHAESGVRRLSEGMELLVTALAAEKLLEFAKSGLEAQVEIGKLAKQTGASVESLSVLSVAAKENDSDMQSLTMALRGLAHSTSELQAGNADAAATFRAIGLSVKDLAGLKPEEQFKKVADALAQYRDGSEKAARVQEIFGRTAQEILPVLKAVAGDGLKELTARAHELGVVLDDEAVEKAEHLSTQLSDLKLATLGVAEQITEHLVPGLTDLAMVATHAVADLPDGVKRAADYVVALAGAATAATVAVRVLGGAWDFFKTTNPEILAVTLALSGLVTVLGVVYEHEKQETDARLAATHASGEHAARARELTKEYKKQASALDSGKLSSAAAAAAKERLKKVTEELRQLGADYAQVLGDETARHDEVTAALERQNQQRLQTLELIRDYQRAQLAAAQADLETAKKPHLLSAKTGQVGTDPYAVRDAQERVDRLRAQFDAADSAVQAATGAGEGSGSLGPPTKPDLAAEKARVAAAIQGLEQDIARFHDEQQAFEQGNAALYADGLRTLGAYYEERRRIIDEYAGKEVATLTREREVLKQTPTSSPAEEVNKQAALSALDAKIAAVRRRQSAQIQQTNNEEIQGAKQLQNDVASALATLDDAIGDHVASTRRAIDAQVEHVRQVLLKLPEYANGGADAVAARLRGALTANVDVAELKRQGELVFGEIANQRTVIEARVNVGEISEADRDRQILALERSRLPVLRELGAAMLQLAQASQNPELIQQAEAFNTQLATMGVKVDEVHKAWVSFGSNISQALQGDLAQFLGQTVAQVHGVDEAFRELALSAFESIQQIVAQLIALEAVQFTKKVLHVGTDAGDVGAGKVVVASSALGTAGAIVQRGGDRVLEGAGALAAAASALAIAAANLQAANAAASFSATFSGGGAPLPFADGGIVTGPGTSTSDSIPAMLSNGEAVLNARAVRRIGPELINQLNAGAPVMAFRDFSGLRLPRFADGGIVGRADTTAGLLSTLNGNLGGEGGHLGTLHVSADEGLTLRHVESRRGGRVLLAWAAKNANALRALLGIK